MAKKVYLKDFFIYKKNIIGISFPLIFLPFPDI